MPAKSDDPIVKVTLNLYEADVLAARAYYGHGWSAELRTFFHNHMQTTTRFHNLRKQLEFEDE